MDLQLTDRPALILGGGGGLGARIARTLAAEGAAVGVADIDEDAARHVARDLDDAIAVGCDLGRREPIDAAVDRVVQAFGSLQILVQAVGLTRVGYLPDITDRDVDLTFDVNMRGSLWAAQAAAAPMRAAGYGRLLFIGSGSGLKGSAGLALYSASKFFLRGLAQAAGLELGPAGVTANVICPGDVYPEGREPAGSWRDEALIRISCEKEGVSDLDALKRKRIARNPARRGCTADDVGDLAAFLCSPRAGFINAQTISLTGGGLPT